MATIIINMFSKHTNVKDRLETKYYQTAITALINGVTKPQKEKSLLVCLGFSITG